MKTATIAIAVCAGISAIIFSAFFGGEAPALTPQTCIGKGGTATVDRWNRLTACTFGVEAIAD